jgi:lysyl-tRNA synthetase class 1
MRWSYEQVDFEPAGEDHAAPGSSFTVGQQIARQIYDFTPPVFTSYAFVGMAGRSKMSSSAGTGATPQAALDILEPAILRWLYLRRWPEQKFNIDFGLEVIRLYDEWDVLVEKAHAGDPTATTVYRLCTKTTTGTIRQSLRRVSFRLLSSAADITQGSFDQTVRVTVATLGLTEAPLDLAEQLEPRLSCAIRWATRYLPDDERTVIRDQFDPNTFAQLDDQVQAGLRILLDQLDDAWSAEGLTRLVYQVPKILLGLPADARPTDELKAAQRRFFAGVYRLICGSDTGPRLPTLFMSIGADREKALLSPD